MNPSNIEAAACANAISQERVCHTVHYPATGDRELDCLSGVLRVIEQSHLSGLGEFRVIEFLKSRFSQAQQPYNQQGILDALKGISDAKLTPPYQQPANPWQTTCGGIGLPQDIESIAGNAFPPTVRNPDVFGKTLCQVFEEDAKCNAKRKK